MARRGVPVGLVLQQTALYSVFGIQGECAPASAAVTAGGLGVSPSFKTSAATQGLLARDEEDEEDGGGVDMFLEVLLESMGQKPARYTAKAFIGSVIALPPPVGGVLVEQDAGLNKVGTGGTTAHTHALTRTLSAHFRLARAAPGASCGRPASAAARSARR